MRKAAGLFLIICLASGFQLISLARAEGTAQQGIEAANAEMMSSYKSKDAAGVAKNYAEDAIAFPPNEAKITGRENIQKMWQSWLDAGVTDLTLKAVEVVESGDFAYEEGTYSVKAPGTGGKVVEEEGKYIVVWKKAADGKWFLHRDIWNTNPAKAAQ